MKGKKPGDQQRIKLYLLATRKIDKGSEKLEISVSNVKDIIDLFLSLANNYGRGRIEFMIQTSSSNKRICWKSDQINIMDMHVKLFGYFGLQVIGNVDQVIPNSLVVQALQNIANHAQKK